MSFERELVEQINLLRTNPKKFAEKLNKYLSYFKGNVLNIPDRPLGISTIEGPKAYKDAINYLERQKPLEPLDPSKGLFRVAADFQKAIQRKNLEDVDSVDIEKIIDKYGTFYGEFSRATDYGSQTPEQALISLVVSDGDPTREQRKALLSPEFKKVGIAFGTHKKFKNCTVILKCTEFINKKDAEDIGYLDDDGGQVDAKKQESKKVKLLQDLMREAMKSLQPPKENKTSQQQNQQPRQYQRAAQPSRPDTQNRRQYGRNQPSSQQNQQPKREEPRQYGRYQPSSQQTQQPKREEPRQYGRYQPSSQQTQQPKREEPRRFGRYQPPSQPAQPSQPPRQEETRKFGRYQRSPQTQPQPKKEEPRQYGRYQPSSQQTQQPKKEETRRIGQYHASSQQAQPAIQPKIEETRKFGRYQRSPQTQPQPKKEEPRQYGRYQPSSQQTQQPKKEEPRTYQRYQPSTRQEVKQETRQTHQYQKTYPITQPIKPSIPNKYDKYNTKKGITKTTYEKKEVVRTLGEGGDGGGFDDFPDFNFGFGDSSGGGDKQVVSEKRSEKVMIEGGKKKKIVTIERTLADGSKESETLIED